MEIIASHQGLSQIGNKIISSDSHQGVSKQRLPLAFFPAFA
jgi:hypothetical protein